MSTIIEIFSMLSAWDLTNDYENKSIKSLVVYHTYLSWWLHLKYFCLLLMAQTLCECNTNAITQYILIWIASICKFSKSTSFVHHSVWDAMNVYCFKIGDYGFKNISNASIGDIMRCKICYSNKQNILYLCLKDKTVN